MSEYQYYEFAAVERPLTAQQQAELRTRSTRATITSSSFINEYHWGDLNGDPIDWVERYFDAHVYSANWGSCRFLLRLPQDTFDPQSLREYAGHPMRASGSSFGPTLEAIDAKGCVLLDWSFNEDSGEDPRFFEGADGPGWMARLLPIRDELLRGDARPLYLGWLARQASGELGNGDLEPPLPDGLGALTPAQVALAEFLVLDPDWLAAAAEKSPPLGAETKCDSRFDSWLLELPGEEMRATLRMLLDGRSQEAERTLRRRFLTWEREKAPKPAKRSRRRVAEIAARVSAHRAIREQREQKAQAALEARRKAERASYLKTLLTGEDRAWASIDKTLQRGSGSAYDEALRGLQDLSEAYSGAKRAPEFRRRLVRLMSHHGNRPAWVTRVTKAGYMWEPER